MAIKNHCLTIAIIEAFETGNSKVLEHIGNEYIQHNLDFPNGKEVLKGFLQKIRKVLKYKTIELLKKEIPLLFRVHMEVIGIMVNHKWLTHADGSFGGQEVAHYDLFRLESELIVEHWGIVAKFQHNRNGKTKTENSEWKLK